MIDDFSEYLHRNREKQIVKYLTARLWCQRKDARAAALHYGRLIRKVGA